MKIHINVENGGPEVQALVAEISNFFHKVGDVEMERVLLFDLDFDLVETHKIYEDSDGVKIRITTKHQEWQNA